MPVVQPFVDFPIAQAVAQVAHRLKDEPWVVSVLPGQREVDPKDLKHGVVSVIVVTVASEADRNRPRIPYCHRLYPVLVVVRDGAEPAPPRRGLFNRGK